MEEVFLQYGISGLAIGSVILVVNLFLSTLKEQREGFETFLSNHMGSQTAAQEKVAEALTNLTAEVRKGRV